MKASTDRNDRWTRLGWFIVLWSGGVAGLAIVAYGLKFVLDRIFLS
jgi:hypothetical protein